MTRLPVRPVRVLALASSALLSGCLVGPNYVRPNAPTPPAFKEAQGWIPAQPADAAPRGDWWTLFNDPVLNQLEQKVVVSNQNLAAAEASFREAEALVAEDRASLFPTLGATASGTRSVTHGAVGTITPGGGQAVPIVGITRNQFSLEGNASWEPDLWGKIRRTVEGAKASAQASAADLVNARLSAQSQLAIDYVQLRADDELKRLTDDTVEGYRRSLQITQNQYNAGTVAKNDVLTAQTQLSNAEAESADFLRQRQLMEHAIAVLAGMPPSELTITPVAWTLQTPDVPVEAPSVLLQRRPDVAAAERSMANANAQIGVQVSAYFPTISLTGSGGVTSSGLASLFSSNSTLWSLGASAAETLVDFGARRARVQQARAAYDQSVAQYRQTVLSAFQEVEDDLASDRQLALEQPLRAQASQAADGAEVIALNQYRAGLTDYTAVVVAQAAALQARQSLITTQSSRIASAIQLITALGGGWSAAELPSLHGPAIPSPL
jgi:NodT family efflux transporter outer membrane factor (OMF) lipoprotein